MAESYLMVRAEVPDPVDRAPFDHWYETDHLPWAIRVFGARRGWRCWSRTEPAVHYAFYEFADVAEAQAATGSEKIAPLVADFDRVWGDRVPRRREISEIVQEEIVQENGTVDALARLPQTNFSTRGRRERFFTAYMLISHYIIDNVFTSWYFRQCRSH